MARPVQGRGVVAARPTSARMQRSAAPRPAATGLAGFGRRPLAALEAKGRTIRDPVEKLRFLRHSIERFETLDERLQVLPGAPLRWVAYRLTGVEETRPLFSKNPWGALDPPRRHRPPLPRRARRTVNAAALLIMAAAGLALAGYPLRRSPETAPAARGDAPAGADGGREARPAARRPLPRADLARGLGRRVRAVQQRPAHRHDLGRARRAAALPRLHDRAAGMGQEVQDRPIGIVYHTSESDLWPLEESFNEKLRDSSQDLLRYLRRNQVYHYLVDRFGRVYRVVEEKDKANHAGMSVWAERRPHLPQPQRADDRGLVRDALGGRARAADHARAARGGPQPQRLPAPQVADRPRAVRHARPRERQPEEAPDRAPPRLGARLPVRGVLAARPVPGGVAGDPARLRVGRPVPGGDERAVAGGEAGGGQAGRRKRRREDEASTRSARSGPGPTTGGWPS